MKSAYAIKLFLAVALGVLSGQTRSRDYAKWHALGREAFLAAQGNRFDQSMAHPAPVSTHIISAGIAVTLLAYVPLLAALVAH